MSDEPKHVSKDARKVAARLKAQQAEPRSVLGFLVATAPKVEAMAGRASKILNTKDAAS